MRVKFYYDLTSDARNWVRIIKSKRTSANVSWDNKIKEIPRNLLDSVLDTDEKNGLVIVESYLRAENKTRQDILEMSIEYLQKCWVKREEKYFKVLETVLGKKIPVTDYRADITTMHFAPYYWPKNWFMVIFWNSLPKQLTSVAHEIFHIEFMRYYAGFLEKHNVTKDDIINITESLTCLLNIEQFKNVLLVPDQGYKKHTEMRDRIFKSYSKHQNLETVLHFFINDCPVSK